MDQFGEVLKEISVNILTSAGIISQSSAPRRALTSDRAQYLQTATKAGRRMKMTPIAWI